MDQKHQKDLPQKRKARYFWPSFTFMPWKMLYIFLYVICQPKLWTWSSDSPHQTQSEDISHRGKRKISSFRSKILNLGFNTVGSIRRTDKCKIWKTYIWGQITNESFSANAAPISSIHRRQN